MVLSDRHEDERGVIQDLFDGEPVAVTYVTTKQGRVRGNHVHEQTTQWTFVVEGRLTVAKQVGDGIVKHLDVPAGTMVTHLPGEPHAWKALGGHRLFRVHPRPPLRARATKPTRTGSTEPLLQ